MSKKIFFDFLILCGILFQGTFATVLEDDDEVSSKLLSRKKRVIDHLAANERPQAVSELYFIVKVLHKLLYICNGIIVSPKHILTGRICVEKAAVMDELHVETGDVTLGPFYFEGFFVSNIFVEGDLAMLELSSEIAESLHWHRRIELNDDVLTQRSHVVIAGWGRMDNIYRRRRSTAQLLGSATCQSHYADNIYYRLTRNYMCTIATNRGMSLTHEDTGAALFFEGKLVGVLLFAGNDLIGGPRPDVFVRVNAKNDYYNWTKSHIRQFLNPFDGSNQLPYNYEEQRQTLHYRAFMNNMFEHPNPAHFSHHPPHPPAPTIVRV